MIVGVTTTRKGLSGAQDVQARAADSGGDCNHAQCPQVRDGEPKRSGRGCPLYCGRKEL